MTSFVHLYVLIENSELVDFLICTGKREVIYDIYVYQKLINVHREKIYPHRFLAEYGPSL